MTNFDLARPSTDVERRTKSDLAYAQLRRAIVTEEIPPGSGLDESNLISTFGFGRTPLREALKRLALERFVSWEIHRTPYVRDVAASELGRLNEAREVLEVPVAALAAERATARDLDQLRATSDSLANAVIAEDFYEAVELDHLFHVTLARATQNVFLEKAVHDLNCGSLRLWHSSLKRFGLPAGDHAAIVEAVQARDVTGAQAEVKRHITESYANLLTIYELRHPEEALARPTVPL